MSLSKFQNSLPEDKMLKARPLIPELEDNMLLQKYSNSENQQWLLVLYCRYEHLIYGVCLKYTKDIEWSKDLKSQIYEKLILSAKGLKVSSFKHWLYTFTKNTCLDALRKRNKTQNALQKFKEFQLIAQEPMYYNRLDLSSIETEQASINNIVQQSIKILPEPQQVCLNLFFYEKKSYLEISNQTGYSLNRVKSYLQNGKRKIKIYVSKALNEKLN